MREKIKPNSLGIRDVLHNTAPGEEVLQKFQMSREESWRLRDIEERLQVIQEVKKREGEMLMQY